MLSKTFSLGRREIAPGHKFCENLQCHGLGANAGVHLRGTGKQQGTWSLFPALPFPRAQDACQAPSCPPKAAPTP